MLDSKIRFSYDPEYIHCKEELDKLYQERTKGAIIRNKCDWNDHGEKSTKFFLNLEKHHVIQNQIRTNFCLEKEIIDEKELNTELLKFYKALSQPKIDVSNALTQDYLNRI